MRICLLTPEFLPSWGGIGTYTYYLARGLQDRVDVHVVTSDAKLSEESLQGLDRVQVHALPMGGRGREGVSSLRFQMSVLRRLPRLAREFGFDVVHSNHAQMSDVFARIRPMDALPVVTIHTTIDAQLAGTARAGPTSLAQGVERTVVRHRRLLRIVERGYLRGSPSLIYVSRWIRNQALERYALQPRIDRVIHNAVDTDRFSPYAWPEPEGAMAAHGDEGRRFVLLYAGRLLAQKGLGTLLRALPFMPRNVHLKIAGPGDAAPWKTFAAAQGVPADRYEFLGRIAYDRMPDLYHAADAVVLPSFLESCPLTALESMASGTPVLAADVGGVSEVVTDGETGWLFPAGDPRALAARVATVAEGGPAVHRTIFQARRWVESNATVARIAEETRAFYGAVLGEVGG